MRPTVQSLLNSSVVENTMTGSSGAIERNDVKGRVAIFSSELVSVH
jgi:hypothetical protein